MEAITSDILNVVSVSKRFGGLLALNKVDVDVREGSIVGVIGPNGSGKTTLFNIITGIVKPDEGKILYRGVDITDVRPHKRVKLGLARTFQNIRVYPYLPVYYNVELTARAVYGDPKLARAKTFWALTITGLLTEAGELPVKLTPYKLKMIELARALVSNPKLLLLDEPFAGLSIEEAESYINTLLSLNRSGVTLLIIEHKLRHLMKIAEKVIVLSNGVKIFEGTPHEVVNNPKVLETYIGGVSAG